MSIESDIKQQNFRTEYQKAFINLIFTYNWASQQLKHLFEDEGLTMQQFNILRILRGSTTPISTLQIRERMLDKMSDTSRIVDRLVVKGLVKKIICTKDKRLVDITISCEGLQLLEGLDAKEALMEDIFKNLTETEAKMLNKLLDKIREPS